MNKTPHKVVYQSRNNIMADRRNFFKISLLTAAGIAISEFEIPDGYSKLYATSFCNKHDLWITEFAL